jgi:type II secretory ATPase GspE/PulE/Tfp pilus assembly ATPase PilB-like protein
VAQRLIRTICPKCKSPYTLKEEELEAIFVSEASVRQSGLEANMVDKDAELRAMYRTAKLYKGQGCESCRRTGYRGRKGIYEILEVTPVLRNLIVQGASDDQLKACAVSQGMKTLKIQGTQKVLDGDTTLQELVRVVNVRED